MKDVSEFSTILVNLIEESFEILFKLEQTNEIKATNELNFNEPTRTTLTSTSATSISTSTAKTEQLQSGVDEASNKKNRKNPIVNLLNGDMLISRKNSEDVSNSRTETFREVNIQMLNSRNLHEGLELEWGETSIDAANNGNILALNEVSLENPFENSFIFSLSFSSHYTSKNLGLCNYPQFCLFV